MESIYHVQNIQYLYLLNKYIKCNFRGQRCSTTPTGVIRHQTVNFTSSHFQFISIYLCLFTSYGNIVFFYLFPLFHQHNLGVNKALVYGVANLHSLEHCQTGEIN